MTKINRFYVGAEHIARAIESKRNDPWSRPTLEAAVKHGKSVMEESDTRDTVIIVKIVRILRRKKTPISIEKV